MVEFSHQTTGLQMIRTVTIATAIAAAIVAMASTSVSARDRGYGGQDDNARFRAHVAPQVNGYGSYVDGHYRTSQDAFRPGAGRAGGNMQLENGVKFNWNANTR